MNNSNDIDLKVCTVCDAPLPNSPKNLNFYNFDEVICDDCYILKDENKRK